MVTASAPRVIGAGLGFRRPRLLLAAAVQLVSANRLHEAEDLLRLLLELAPEDAVASSTLASVRERLGDLDGSLALFERAHEMAPTNPLVLTNYIFALDRHPSTTLERAYTIRRRYHDLVKAEPMSHTNDRDPERRLRIGYVSADFRNHSATTAFGPVILKHDPEQFDVHLYSSTPEHDWLTDVFKAAVPHWHDVKHLSDGALARQIQDDGIDILVDLSGHSSGTRLPVFARKPAPVQATGWGYITGTGLDAMDYLFADADTIAPEEERFYAERVVRLPRLLAYWASDPAAVGEVQPPPCARNGHLTFGVFQRLGKLHPACLKLWARVLDAIPDARLIVKAPGLEHRPLDDLLRARLAGAGADNGRIRFYGASDKNDHLKAYADVDVALDPWPDGGGVSTLEAAWMGVPTLTSPWHQIPSRVTSSVNRELGLDDFIVGGPSAYVERARAIDEQRPALAEIRRWLRPLLQASAFCSHERYARTVEGHYREFWRAWCARAADEPAGLRLVV